VSDVRQSHSYSQSQARTAATAAAAAASREQERRARILRVAIAVTVTMLALLAPRIAHGQDWRTMTASRQLAGENALRVDVEYGAGHLKLGPATGGMLYRASIRFDADAFRPKVAYSDGRLRIGMEGGNVRGRNLRDSRLDVLLTPDVPVDLRIAFGAADANVELGGLRIQRAHVQTGASRTTLNVSSRNLTECEEFEIEVGAASFEANHLGNLNAKQVTVHGGVGEVTLDFTGDWRQDLSGTIAMGLGTLTLRVPRGLGVSVEKGGMLSSFDSQGLIKRGNVYYSENFDSAPHKLKLDIEAALGSIRVEWVDS
jgi:hypothetical protein